MCLCKAILVLRAVDLSLIWAENDDLGLTRLGIALGDPHVWLDTENITLRHVNPSDVLDRYHSNFSAVAFR